MKKFILAFFILLCAKDVYASEDFLVAATSTYEVSESSSTKVTHEITVTNTRTEVYATDYTLTIRGSEPKSVRAYSGEKEYETQVEVKDGVEIKVLFDDPVVGEGKSRDFTVEYFDSSVVKTTRDVVEVSVPKLAQDNFSSYLVKLKIPVLLGRNAHISPAPDNILETAGFKTYFFEKLSVASVGVAAAFGEYQVFSFDLTYHLQNPLAWGTQMEIALPPDTSYQKVYYESLNPKPKNIYIDPDGNWIAIYPIGARERLDVRAIGSARIFASPWQTPKYSEIDDRYLGASEYWQVEDPEIKKIAEDLGSAREIYDYVVSRLSYNYGRVATGSVRLGALEALKNPKDATCTEFTDLFIALARAAGIPAREVNGYAHTDNSRLRPLSLVADVLHAWPEYWDNESKMWVAIDPTWENTTGGTDYFTKLDMKHLTFVARGADPEFPISPGSYKLGANPQKDVFVSYGTLPEKTESEPAINIFQRTSLPFFGLVLVAEIENPGPSALYSQKVELRYDESTKYENELPVLLPYERRTLEFTMPYGFLGNVMPARALLSVGKSSSDFETNKNSAQIRDVVSAFLGAVFLIGGLVYWRKRRAW